MSAYAMGTSTYREKNLEAGTKELVRRLDISAAGVEAAEAKIEESGDDFREEKLGSLIKWIPGDVVASYALLIAAFAGSQSQPGDWIVWVGLALAVVLVYTGAYRESKKRKDISFGVFSVTGRALAGALAFLIWSLAVPLSPSRDWAIVSEVPDAGLAAIVAVAAAVFVAVADTIFGD